MQNFSKGVGDSTNEEKNEQTNEQTNERTNASYNFSETRNYFPKNVNFCAWKSSSQFER